MLIYRLKDMKAEAFKLPFFSETHGTAMRSVMAGLRDDPSQRHVAEDFALYCVGSEDPISGRLTARDPEHVVDVTELIRMLATEE